MMHILTREELATSGTLQAEIIHICMTVKSLSVEERDLITLKLGALILQLEYVCAGRPEHMERHWRVSMTMLQEYEALRSLHIGERVNRAKHSKPEQIGPLAVRWVARRGSR